MYCRFTKTLFLFALVTIISTISVKSQNQDYTGEIPKALELINIKGDFYASVKSDDASVAREQILQYASIDYTSGDSIYAYFNKRALDILIENGIPFKIVKSPGEVDFELNMNTWEDLLSKDLTDTWDFYPTYEAYENLMYQFETDFPELCKVHNIVTLSSGRSIFFAKLSANVNEREAEPRFMYTSTMHGDETTGFVLSLRLIHYMLTQYGIDDEITWLLDNMEIWISPNENPDGTYTNNNNTVSGATRSNANGIDLNRNYPNPVDDPSSTIQAETQAMINLTDTVHFVMSANMHGGIECVNYPWDSWESNQKTHADHFWWQLVM
ncbi:MAG: M14 family zinc carboxypeptidase, partial [Bacteroidales bacterium]